MRALALGDGVTLALGLALADVGAVLGDWQTLSYPTREHDGFGDRCG